MPWWRSRADELHLPPPRTNRVYTYPETSLPSVTTAGTSITEFADPALTTVRQPVDRLALEASRSVIALVSNREVRTGELLLDWELVIRASTGRSETAVPPGRSKAGQDFSGPCQRRGQGFSGSSTL